MITIKVDQHFVVYQFGYTAGILPINTNAYIGLLKFIKIIVDNNIGTALQSILNKFLYVGEFLFSHLGNVFAKCQSILAEITIEIFCLVIFPCEFLVLHTVFSKFHIVHLRCGFHHHEN